MTNLKSKPNVPAVCQQLQQLQRQRSIVIKSRNMQLNRLRAIIACTLGYDPNRMGEKDRTAKFKEADGLLADVKAGKRDHEFREIILTTLKATDAFDQLQEGFEVGMLALVKLLPVASWAEAKEQTGFGLLSLAKIVGECGDLSNYANPAKVWRRMGCAPWQFGDKTLMGATWRGGKQGKLPASEWEQFGYSPRRRSVAYLIGEGLMKQNYKQAKTAKGTKKRVWTGPYRERYEEARKVFDQRHPECQEDGKKKRSQLHGMLLAIKLLLKNLWIEWHKK